MQKLINGEFKECNESSLVGGDVYRVLVGGGGWQQQTYASTNPSKERGERYWRDEELLRTDKLIILPDFPKDLRQYRKALRDYPNQSDFPNGTRPVEGG